MTNYRRNRIAGGSYFFTVNLADRRLKLLTENIAILRAAFRYTRLRYPFALDAIVVLPDHLHAIWTLPQDDHDFALRWRLIKSAFSRALPHGEIISQSRADKGERGIWRRRYWEHTVRDEADFSRHVDYIHFNPAKHGYVTQVRDWPYSSFGRMVKLGIYPGDWAVQSKRRAASASDKAFDGFRCAQPILQTEVALTPHSAARAARPESEARQTARTGTSRR